MHTLLIVDDHEIVRRGLKLLISDFCPALEIFEAHDGDSAIEQLKKRPFDLVTLDIHMPNTNSFGLLEHITSRYPGTKVLIFSMNSDTWYGKRFIKAGARGYLSKDASVEEVKKAVETVMSGRRYMSEELMDAFVKDQNGGQENPFNQLSAREFEITALLLTGMPIGEIAARLHLQPSTAGTYKARIFDKLNVSNVLQLKELAALFNFK